MTVPLLLASAVAVPSCWYLFSAAGGQVRRVSGNWMDHPCAPKETYC
jgi:hypothetical protein